MTTQIRHNLKYEDFAPYFKVVGGHLVRLIDSPTSGKAGDIIGLKPFKNYITFGHNGKFYRAHRIIYLLTHGTCPDIIDHINGNIHDNRPENLRAADFNNNTQNAKINKKNSSGVKGVHQMKDGTGFQASITYNGKRKFLGLFKTLKEADEVISLARDMVHGQFANHGVRA